MSHSQTDSAVEPAFAEEERAQIMRHLNWVLANPSFAQSRRSQSFLRYIVEEALAGRADNIKERNIGVDVFGKSVDFDPQEESVVRVAAGEVRRRLQDAYKSGPSDGVRIQLPVGCYSPKFNLEKTSSEPTVSAAAQASPTPQRDWLATVCNWRSGLYAIVLLLCASASGFLALREWRSQKPLDEFWGSFAGYKQEVLIALPSPSVVQVRGSGNLPVYRPERVVPTESLDIRDGAFTGAGAGWGCAQFVKQLAVRHQPFRIGFGSAVSFADLGRSPSILLGGQTSKVGMQMTNGLRYRIVRKGNTSGIVDSRDESKTWFYFRDPAPAETEQGYTLITFLNKSSSSFPVLVVAGLGPADTRAGAEFLTNSEYFQEFADKAPKGWPEKNFQVILHDVSYAGLPLKPTIVAWYVW